MFRKAPLFVVALACLGLASPAGARNETFRWTHSDAAAVDHFELHHGPASGSYTTVIDVGKPTPAGGIFSYDLAVADDATLFACVTAVDANDLPSPCSNEQTREPDPGPPPPVAPPPVSIGAGIWGEGFDTLPTGTAVADWVDTQANFSLQPDDSLFGVVAFADGSHGLSTFSTEVDIHSHFLGVDGTGAPSYTWENYELRGHMLIDDPQGGIGVTAVSEFDADTAYHRLRAEGGAAFEIASIGVGVYQCSPASTGVVPQANTWYAFALQVTDDGSQTSIGAKVWPAGSAEPADFQAQCTVSSTVRLTAGTIGVWSSGPGAKYWDDLDVTAVEEEVVPDPTPELGTPGRPQLVY